MKNLFEFLAIRECDKNIFIETCSLLSEEMINESFKSSLLTKLAKEIKDIESKNREKDKRQEQHYKEMGYSGSPSKSARSFASIFGPKEETPRYGSKKTGLQGIKWNEIKDEDFKEYPNDAKELKKIFQQVWGEKLAAEFIVCKGEDILLFIRGYRGKGQDVVTYYFQTEGWNVGVQAKQATKYKYDKRNLKWNEVYDMIHDSEDPLKVYMLEVTDSIIKDYDELHKEREESKKGVIEMDEASMKALLKQQQGRYNAMVKEIKAKKLQSDPNVLFDEIKKANDDVVELFKKVMSKPENMDMRFDLSDLMRYVSYAYEEFYKSMKSQRDSDRHKERAKQRAKERGEEFNDDDYGKYDFDKSNAKEQIRDSKEYLEKVKKMIKEIEDNLK